MKRPTARLALDATDATDLLTMCLGFIGELEGVSTFDGSDFETRCRILTERVVRLEAQLNHPERDHPHTFAPGTNRGACEICGRQWNHRIHGRTNR